MESTNSTDSKALELVEQSNQTSQPGNARPSEETVTPATKVATIVFHPDGDVMLVLSSESGQARFQASSQILSLSSPVFRAMLNIKSGFKEGKQLADRESGSPPVELLLGDDNPNALAIILRILHLQTRWVPESIGPERLYQIAIICDKYDMQQSLDLWLAKWTPEHFGGTVTMDKWLFVAYAFRKAIKFESLSRELMLECEAIAGWDGAPRLTLSVPKFYHGTIFFNEYVPQTVVNEIAAARQQAIEAIFDCVHQQIERYSDPNTVKCTKLSPLCDSLILGFLIRSFKRIKVYPDASTMPYKSVRSLRQALDDSVCFPEQIVLGKPSGGCCPTPGYPRACVGYRDSWRSCSDVIICTNCKRWYCPPQEGKNHALTCNPVPGFKKELDDIIDKIKGLECKRFVGNKATQNVECAPPPEDGDLWDCIHYE